MQGSISKVIMTFFSCRDPREIIIVFNSTVCYLAACLILLLASWISSLVPFLLSEMPGLISGNRGVSEVLASEWGKDLIVNGYCTNPVISMFAACISLPFYRHCACYKMFSGLLLTWIIIRGFADFFGGIIVGAALNSGLGDVFTNLGILDTGRVIVTIFCLAAVFLISRLLTRRMMISANVYYNELRDGAKLRFGFLQFLIPCVLGNFIITVNWVNHTCIFDLLVNFSVLLIIIPLIVNAVNTQDLFFDKEPRTATKFFDSAVMIAFVMVVLLIVT